MRRSIDRSQLQKLTESGASEQNSNSNFENVQDLLGQNNFTNKMYMFKENKDQLGRQNEKTLNQNYNNGSIIYKRTNSKA